MTKIDIISGFLGAGKTTLIKKLLKDCFKNERVVLIENEFGEIGIDGGFLKDSGIEIREMNSGCICCSLVGDFGKSLKEVIEKYSPDRIIIEPSGVGKLSDVMKAVVDTASELPVTLNSAVAVVDAVKCKMYMKNFGEFFNNQIEAANAIVLSRTDKLSQEKIEAVVDMIKEHNSSAHIITTPWNSIEGKAILSAMEGEDMMKSLLEEYKHDHEEDDDDDDDHDEHAHEHHHEHSHHHHHHHADEVFTSVGTETPKKFSKDKLKDILEKLAYDENYGVILRAKGILPSDDVAEGKFLQFDLTPGEYEIREGSADYTGRICVIGSKIDEDKIKSLFDL